MKYEVRHYVTIVRDVTVTADSEEEAFDAVRDALDAGCLSWPDLDKLGPVETPCAKHHPMEVGSWEFSDTDDDWNTEEVTP